MQNSWFTVKVRYTKQQDNGLFKKVTESYLVAAETFGDAEVRIYIELGEFIKGEFNVVDITRFEVYDIFQDDNFEKWFNCTISVFSQEDEKTAKNVKKVILLTAESVEDASRKLKITLKDVLVDFTIPSIKESNIVDIFPYPATDEE